MDVIEWNPTGEIIERPFTEAEAVTHAEYLANQASREAAATEKAKADAKASQDAIAHAKSLGFTDAMIAVMYPNLGAQSE